VAERKGDALERGPGKFVTARDIGTEKLAMALADAIEKRMGKRPYLVVAKFHRKYADANRPAELAFEDPKAKPAYEAYHAALARYCQSVQKEYGRGLLLDVHGQVAATDTIFRGTQNGKTVTLLTQRFGPGAQNGPKSFFGLLEAAGCKVYPRDDSKEKSSFTGGHIVMTYGSHTVYAIDAIQCEFGTEYRTKEKIKDTAEKVAKAVDDFAKLYLLEDKKH
jgi:N-formylglutamate amidohydrolase